jgi:hypothetical protein
LSTLSLIFSLAAFAADPAVCVTREIGMDGKIVEGRTEIHYGAGHLLRNGVKARFLSQQNGALPGVPALVAAWRACNTLPDSRRPGQTFSKRMECTNEVILKHSPERSNSDTSLADTAYLGLVFLLIKESVTDEEAGVPIELDFSKVAGFRALQLDKANSFGTPGLYEYLDASGNLLSRFLINNPLILECR